MAATKPRFQTIHESRGCLGGWAYRATSDGSTVNLQTRQAGAASWQTKATMLRADFDVEAEKRGMFSPYGGDSPSHIYVMIRNIQDDADMIPDDPDA